MSSPPEATDLADRLDRVLPPHSQAVPDAAPSGDPAVAAAVRLARGPHPALADDAAARIESRVLTRAAGAALSRASWQRRMACQARWAAAACLVLILVSVSTGVASAGSLPGDTLYPVKRLVEQGRLAVASDTGEIDLRLEFTDRRLDEFEELLDRGHLDTDPLADSVDEMNATLRLMDRGIGSAADAERLLALSERHLQLADKARAELNADGPQSDQLLETVTSATEIADKARQYAQPPVESQAQDAPTSTPDDAPPHLLRYGKRRALSASETSTFIPRDDTAPLVPSDPGSTAVYIPSAPVEAAPPEQSAPDPAPPESEPPPRPPAPRPPRVPVEDEDEDEDDAPPLPPIEAEPLPEINLPGQRAPLVAESDAPDEPRAPESSPPDVGEPGPPPGDNAPAQPPPALVEAAPPADPTPQRVPVEDDPGPSPDGAEPPPENAGPMPQRGMAEAEAVPPGGGE